MPPISVKYDEVAVLFPNQPVRRLNTLTPATYFTSKVVKQIAKIYFTMAYSIVGHQITAPPGVSYDETLATLNRSHSIAAMQEAITASILPEERPLTGRTLPALSQIVLVAARQARKTGSFWCEIVRPLIPSVHSAQAGAIVRIPCSTAVTAIPRRRQSISADSWCARGSTPTCRTEYVALRSLTAASITCMSWISPDIWRR